MSPNPASSLKAPPPVYPVTEYLRPWKLFSFSAGLAFLIYGAVNFHIADWDVGLSLIMGLLTYLTAPWAAHIILQGRWRHYPLALFWILFTVDGSYVWYHLTVGGAMYREANFPASLSLYMLCAAIWYPRQALQDFIPHLPRKTP